MIKRSILLIEDLSSAPSTQTFVTQVSGYLAFVDTCTHVHTPPTEAHIIKNNKMDTLKKCSGSNSRFVRIRQAKTKLADYRVVCCYHVVLARDLMYNIISYL